MSRLHRHGEPLHPGLAVPSPKCPWCDEGCDETPAHLFWQCEAFAAPREKFLADLKTITGNKPSLPLAEWERTCKNNGLCPQDPAAIEWLHSLPSEFDYPPLPPWRPSSDCEYLFGEGRTLFATDGGTDFPADRRLRHCGIGVYGGGDSSWHYTSPLRGPVQMNDKAELMAVVLAAEALQGQADLFPKGVEFIIDNQFV